MLVSTDGSENANRAVKAAISIASQYRAELVIVHVVSEIVPYSYAPLGVPTPPTDYSQFFQSAETAGKKVVEAAVAEATAQSVRATGLIQTTASSIVETILDAAEKEKVGLIVVGTRGLGGFKKLVLGSVSSGVVSHARCSVLVVR